MNRNSTREREGVVTVVGVVKRSVDELVDIFGRWITGMAVGCGRRLGDGEKRGGVDGCSHYGQLVHGRYNVPVRCGLADLLQWLRWMIDGFTTHDSLKKRRSARSRGWAGRLSLQHAMGRLPPTKLRSQPRKRCSEGQERRGRASS
jgi:hypothetical protein